MPATDEADQVAPWYSLRLPAKLEEQFRAQAQAGSGAYIRSWLLVFIVFNILSLKVDLDLFGVEAFAEPLVLTVGVFIPTALIAIAALRGSPSAGRQAAAIIVPSLVDMAIVLNSARIVPAPHADTYLVLAVIVPLVVGMIAPLSFRQTMLFCGSSLALYVGFVVGFMAHGKASTGIPILIAGLILVPLKVAYIRERALKQGFLLQIAKNRQATELAAANARLTVLSETDALTGIANRRSFDVSFGLAWSEAAAVQDWLAVASIDIDFFKRLNDTAGHLAGDRCLTAVAAVLRGPVEACGGFLARTGGEEFVAFAPGAALAEVLLLGERLREAVATLGFPHPDLPDGCCVTVSIGVTAAHGAAAAVGAGTDQILKAADEALYLAKGGGRNRVEAVAFDSGSANHPSPRLVA